MSPEKKLTKIRIRKIPFQELPPPTISSFSNGAFRKEVVASSNIPHGRDPSSLHMWRSENILLWGRAGKAIILSSAVYSDRIGVWCRVYDGTFWRVISNWLQAPHCRTTVKSHWLILYPTYYSWKQTKTLKKKPKQALIFTQVLHHSTKIFLHPQWGAQIFLLVTSRHRVGENVPCSLSPFFPSLQTQFPALPCMSLLLVLTRRVEGTHLHSRTPRPCRSCLLQVSFVVFRYRNHSWGV